MFPSRDRPQWSTEGRDWPNREASRFVSSNSLSWHVQIMGEGPDLLLLHGTGASTHSWRDVAPLLASRFRVIMPDLPGHGFSDYPGARSLSLRAMSGSVAALMRTLGAEPVAGIGHSAGAAVLAAMAIEQRQALEGIISINGAFLPIRHAQIFSPLAKLLFLNPLTPHLFARRAAGAGAVERLIEGTGSRIDRRGIELYRRLMRHAGHVEGALGMMANWDLDWLRGALPRLDVPLLLVTAPGDKAVPTSDAATVANLAPRARVVPFGRGGHLAHEEYPVAMSELIQTLLDSLPIDRSMFAKTGDIR